MIKYIWVVILALLYLRTLLDCVGSFILIHKLHVKKERRSACFWQSISPLTYVTLSATVVIILFYSFSSWLGGF